MMEYENDFETGGTSTLPLHRCPTMSTNSSYDSGIHVDSGDSGNSEEKSPEEMMLVYGNLIREYIARNGRTHDDLRGGKASNAIESVTADDLLRHDAVLFKLPSIMVNVNEDAAHSCLSNVYMVPREHLQLLNELVFAIEVDSSEDHNINVFRRLVTEVRKHELPNEDAETPLNCMEFLLETTRDSQLYGDFVNVANDTICFDMIREYVCDELGLLVRASPIVEPVNGSVYFYSQLADDRYADLRLSIKQHCNETVYNQMQYILQRFTATLLFLPGRQVRFTSKIANICLFFILISQLGRPVLDRAFVCVYFNLLGFLVDCTLRLRVITNWHKYPCTRQLLSEIVTNYNKDNTMVKLCRLRDHRDRIDYLLSLMKNDPKHEKMVSTFSYTEYTNILQEQLICVPETGQSYYFFDYDFITSFLNTNSIKALMDHLKVKIPVTK